MSSEANYVKVVEDSFVPYGTFQYWQKNILEWAKRKGWHSPDRAFGDWTSLFHTEISEAYEDFRNHRKNDEIYYEAIDGTKLPKPCGIPIEMADLVIRVLHFCETYGIDLNQMIALKMAYNETRPHRHGGKKE